MRPKRPLRGGLPGFSLNIPTETKVAEVRVEQKAQDDVNRLFVDVDDTIESPMITTAPQFSNPDAKKDGRGSPAAANNGAKFIHVDNTNIFVLVDGISMFLDGKSTFTGENDQLVSQHLQSKQRDRSLAKKQQQENARALLASASLNALDSVALAIRNIEQTVATFGTDDTVASGTVSTASSPCLAPAAPVLSAASRGRCIGSPTTAPLAPPDEFSSLFSAAKKPSQPPLFRSATATSALDALASSMCATHPRPSDETGHADNSNAADPPRLKLTSSASCSVLPQKMLDRSENMSKSFLSSSGRGRGTAQSLSSHPNPLTDGSSSSLASMTSARNEAGGGRRKGAREKPLTANDIGRSNKTLDLEAVEFLHLVGTGTQGKVYCVRLDDKLYALKQIDVNEALEATNDVERQGRKRGLVKELHAIQMQSSRPPPSHVMQLFNAVVDMEQEQRQLHILMELMSVDVEGLKNMAARLPSANVMSTGQSIFKTGFSGSHNFNDYAKKVTDGYVQSSRRLLGRKSFAVMENWEKAYDRQSALPEIVLSMLASDILCGLRELHTDYGLVHCDLKPANVLLSFDRQRFKLADFGCATVIDPVTQEVRRSGVDLGSKLYKAPERLAGCSTDSDSFADDDDHVGGSGAFVFTSKADVWSLGILILELGNGAHPCNPIKDNFWEYTSNLCLRKMLKPHNWSPLFSDFIVHCLDVDPAARWSVNQLLKHPFICKYASVPRHKLKAFVDKLETASRLYQREEKKKLLEQQILASTVQSSNVDTIQSRIIWTGYTSHLRTGPSLQDLKSFPKLE